MCAAQANVMLSYTLPEALELLQSKLSAAQTSLETCEEDLDFLREQITVRSISLSIAFWRPIFDSLFEGMTFSY